MSRRCLGSTNGPISEARSSSVPLQDSSSSKTTISNSSASTWPMRSCSSTSTSTCLKWSRLSTKGKRSTGRTSSLSTIRYILAQSSSRALRCILPRLGIRCTVRAGLVILSRNLSPAREDLKALLVRRESSKAPYNVKIRCLSWALAITNITVAVYRQAL